MRRLREGWASAALPSFFRWQDFGERVREFHPKRSSKCGPYGCWAEDAWCGLQVESGSKLPHSI